MKKKIYLAWEKFLFEGGKKPKWINNIKIQKCEFEEGMDLVDVDCQISYSKYNLEDLIKNLFGLMINRKEVSDFSLTLEKNLDLSALIDIEKKAIKQNLQKSLSVDFRFSYYKKRVK